MEDAAGRESEEGEMKILEMEEHHYFFYRTWRLFVYNEKDGVVITATPIKQLDRSGRRERRYFKTRKLCVEFLKYRREALRPQGTQYAFCKKAIELLTLSQEQAVATAQRFGPQG